MSTAVALQAGGKVSGIVPTTIEEVFRLATAIAKSGLAPRDMATAEKLTVAIMHGMELGLPPMQAVQRIAVINGRPTIWGDAIPALLLSRGFKLRERVEGIGEALIAFCEVVRPDGEKIERQFSVADAKTAKLWSKPGPWQQFPSRMLQMRARGFASRDGAADVLGGLYLREEIDETPMRDVTPLKPAVAAIPFDIPEPTAAPVEAEASQEVPSEAVLRDLEKALATATSATAVKDVRAAFANQLAALDEASHDAAIDMIEATLQAAE